LIDIVRDPIIIGIQLVGSTTFGIHGRVCNRALALIQVIEHPIIVLIGCWTPIFVRTILVYICYSGLTNALISHCTRTVVTESIVISVYPLRGFILVPIN
tara:strand:+ start:1673 stop:1972 length:300 start_codon:yes stop_codon:yes gene_type:complete